MTERLTSVGSHHQATSSMEAGPTVGGHLVVVHDTNVN